MATYGKPANNHHLRNMFLKATACTALLFGSYQFYTPDSWKDSVGQKVEHMTGSKTIGHVMGTLHPYGQASAPAAPAAPAPAPAPGK